MDERRKEILAEQQEHKLRVEQGVAVERDYKDRSAWTACHRSNIQEWAQQIDAKFEEITRDKKFAYQPAPELDINAPVTLQEKKARAEAQFLSRLRDTLIQDCKDSPREIIERDLVYAVLSGEMDPVDTKRFLLECFKNNTKEFLLGYCIGFVLDENDLLLRSQAKKWVDENIKE